MRIAPDGCLRIGSTMFQVKRRIVGHSAAGTYLTYECENADGTGRLLVTPAGAAGPAAIRWIQNGIGRELSEDDVEVFG